MQNNSIPLVSISCITYNHAPYIRQCLDGFIMQKTNFAFEVLIHDDASTDGTEEIIREYEKNYPEIIKPLYEDENQWQKGRGGGRVFNFPRSQGKYIAMCEGDDYWTDTLKLQKQVDFLEANDKYSLCFHNAVEHYEDGSRPDKCFSNVEDRDYTGVEIYRTWTIPTASILFRSNIVKDDLVIKKLSNPAFIFGDTPLFLACSEKGKLRGMGDCMSIYRKHSSGASSNKDIQQLIKLCYHDYAIGKTFNSEILRVSKYLYISRSSIYSLLFLSKGQFATSITFFKFLFSNFSFIGMYDFLCTRIKDVNK